MDLRRFLDLYIAETQEHLRTLGRTLLELEAGSVEAVAEAFRSAHTIKGLSAAMGYADVAQLAHVLEDTLARVRDGTMKTDAALVDSLLRQADELDHAVTNAVANVTPQLDGGAVAAQPAPRRQVTELPADVTIPAGTTRIGVVRLREDAPIKSARALLIMRGLEDRPGFLGAHPVTFDDSYDGVLHLFFSEADEPAIEESVRRAGDVEAVTVHAAESATRAVTKTAAELRGALRARVGDTGVPARRVVTLWACALVAGAAGMGTARLLAGQGALVTALVVVPVFGATYLGLTRLLGVDDARRA